VGDPTRSFLYFLHCWLIVIKETVDGISVLNADVESIFFFSFLNFECYMLL